MTHLPCGWMWLMWFTLFFVYTMSCIKQSGFILEQYMNIFWWCPKMYADKRRANKKQRRHGIFEVWKLKIPFAVPVAVGRI